MNYGNRWLYFLIIPVLLAVLAISGCQKEAEPTPAATPASNASPSQNNKPSPSSSAPLDSINLKLVAEGFTSPINLIESPDFSSRLFVADQIGQIWIVTPDGKKSDEPFLDLRSKMVTLNSVYDERGLLGLAFHPLFRQNGRFFVYYSAPLRAGAPEGFNCTSVISEFKVIPGDLNKADPNSERIILQVDKPQSNHNAGQVAFGPDGFLYISIGDGGGANDVAPGHSASGNGQDINTLLGKILRIDVNGKQPYAVPADNPFAGKDGLDEIFALGFRNPFRFSFDTGGQHELLVGDVGQNMREEVDIVTRGGNYGWNIKEGNIWFDPQKPNTPLTSGPGVDSRGQNLIDPIMDYVNSAGGGQGTAVLGGYVYRGSAVPGLFGNYIFGDYTTRADQADGRLFLGVRSSSGKWTKMDLKAANNSNGLLNSYLRAFGQDTAGELYVLCADIRGPADSAGKIFKIVP